MKADIERLVSHLKTQMEFSKAIDSQFVYITMREAEKCLELAEVEDTLLSTPVRALVKAGGNSWVCVCSECKSNIDSMDKFCRQCGRKIHY